MRGQLAIRMLTAPARLWRAYWFSRPARYSIGIARIAISLSALLALCCHILPAFECSVETSRLAIYQPEGILHLFGAQRPPVWMFEAARYLAIASTCCALVGLFTRASMLLSALSNLLLASLIYSYAPGWSHRLNVILLAQIAFLFARGGDSLSIDRWLNRGRAVANPSGWPILLAQWAVMLMFANACGYKIASSDSFGWVFSDSLRNLLVMRYDLHQEPAPALIQWIIAEPWRYHTAAAVNLATQGLVIFSCIFATRPVLRALFGLFFVAETIGLGVIMGLWNFHWLPLYALCIDWDWLIHCWAQRRRGISTASRDAPQTIGRWPWRLAASAYIVAFLGYDLFAGIRYPRLDNATYPFGAFPFFSTVYARPPLDQHQTHSVTYGRFDVVSDRPVSSDLIFWLHSEYAYLFQSEDPELTRAALHTVLPSASTRFDTTGIERVDVYRGMYAIAPYPAPPKTRLIGEGLVGSVSREGQTRTLAAKIIRDPNDRRYCLELVPTGYENATCDRFSCLFQPAQQPCPLVRHELQPKALNFEQRGNRLYFTCSRNGNYLFSIRLIDAGSGEPRPDIFLVQHGWFEAVGLKMAAGDCTPTYAGHGLESALDGNTFNNYVAAVADLPLPHTFTLALAQPSKLDRLELCWESDENCGQDYRVEQLDAGGDVVRTLATVENATGMHQQTPLDGSQPCSRIRVVISRFRGQPRLLLRKAEIFAAEEPASPSSVTAEASTLVPVQGRK